jgi:hypothetical protein
VLGVASIETYMIRLGKVGCIGRFIGREGFEYVLNGKGREKMCERKKAGTLCTIDSNIVLRMDDMSSPGCIELQISNIDMGGAWIVF